MPYPEDDASGWVTSPDNFPSPDVDPRMSQQLMDWYLKNASPIGERFVNQATRGARALANVPQNLYKGAANALDWAGRNVAAPALGQMADVAEADRSQQPFIGWGEQGPTGRAFDLASFLAPYLVGGAPGGSATLPAGVMLPGKKYGYPDIYEGGYHGTHTVFGATPENQLGEFMNRFIGSGEGAQAFGYGHYVGARKGTGASYMPSGEDMALHIGDQPWNPFRGYNPADSSSSVGREAERTAHDMLMDAPRIATPNGHIPDVASVVEDLKGSIADLTKRYNLNSTRDPNTGELHYPQLVKENLSHLEHDKKVLDFVQSNEDKFKFETPGSLYHVEMKPPEESLMHWDKKIKDQPPEVQEKLKQVNERLKNDDRVTWESSQDMTAGDWYKQAKQNPVLSRDYPGMTGNGQALSEAMKEAGIPGLRFADQNSRGIFNTKERVADINRQIKDAHDLASRYEPNHPNYNPELAAKDPNKIVLSMAGDHLDELTNELSSLQRLIKQQSELQVEGKPLTKPEHVPQLSKNDFAKGEALSWLFDTKDVDSAISKIKKEMEFTSESSRYERSEKAIEWLEKNRDKIKLKEPDVTHNYVIFDPKDLNIIHREKNMPKGYI